MPPPCKVCSSLSRAELERLRAEGKSFRELSRVAKERFNEDIHFTAFARHFNPKHKTIEQRSIFVPDNKRHNFRIEMEEGKGSMRDFNDLK